MTTINGAQTKIAHPMTITNYLEKNQYQINRIAVELNGAIVPKSQYALIVLQDGDVVEIVSFVGGG